MTYKEIVDKVAKSNGMPYELVDKTYKAFWKYIKNSVQNLPLKEELTEAEFFSLKPNFNIPSLGKLVCTYDRYLGVKKKFDCIKKLRKYEKAKED